MIHILTQSRSPIVLDEERSSPDALDTSTSRRDAAMAILLVERMADMRLGLVYLPRRPGNHGRLIMM